MRRGKKQPVMPLINDETSHGAMVQRALKFENSTHCPKINRDDARLACADDQHGVVVCFVVLDPYSELMVRELIFAHNLQLAESGRWVDVGKVYLHSMHTSVAAGTDKAVGVFDKAKSGHVDAACVPVCLA
jgi:hypothetical protein